MPRVARGAPSVQPELVEAAEPEVDAMDSTGVYSTTVVAEQVEAAEIQRLKVEAAFASEPLSAEQHELSGAAGLDGSGADDVVSAVNTPAKRGRTREVKKEAVPVASAGSALAGFYQLDEADEKLKICLYGREGTRKTTGLATSTQAGPTLVVSAEGGLKASALKKHGVKVENLAVWPGPEDKAVTEAGLARRLEALHERLLAGFHRDPAFLYAVHLDSFSELFSVLRDQAQEGRVDKALAKPGVTEDMVDIDFVDRDDYGIATNQARKILRRFRDLPCHVVITALEKYDEKEDAIVPAVSPAIRIDLLGMVDMVLYSKVDPVTDEEDAPEFHRALTASGAKGATRGKDRYDALPRVLVEPTFVRILGYKTGELVESEDPLQVAYHEERARLASEHNQRELERAAKKAEQEAAKAAKETATPTRRSRAKAAPAVPAA